MSQKLIHILGDNPNFVDFELSMKSYGKLTILRSTGLLITELVKVLEIDSHSER